LLEGERGVFRLLDEQCALGRSQSNPADDCAALLKQIEYYNLDINSHYLSSHPGHSRSSGAAGRGNGGKFSIRHFAGDVEYTAIAFIAKNMDKMEGDLEEVLKNSSNKLLSSLFNFQLTSDSQQLSHYASTAPAAKESRGGALGGGGQKKKQLVTISSKFKANLNDLMVECKSTSIHYVKCFKSNRLKKPMHFDPQLVYAQLKYSGIYEV
jgi:myosin heavy subunit